MYKLIGTEAREEIIINKSRFIGTSFRCDGEDEAKKRLFEIKKEFSDATHNCYAYIFDALGNAMRFSDDGEPQGTAGMPILDVLKNKKLVSSGVVVTRYFGGIKLGAGGLVRAYAECAAKTLEKSGVCVMTEAVEFSLSVEYNLASLAERFAADYVLLSVDYAERVIFRGVCRKSEEEILKTRFADLTNGRGKYTAICERVFAFED